MTIRIGTPEAAPFQYDSHLFHAYWLMIGDEFHVSEEDTATCYGHRQDGMPRRYARARNRRRVRRPDLVLVYRKCGSDALELVRIGSHAQLGL